MAMPVENVFHQAAALLVNATVRDAQGGKVILFCGARGGEGTTTCVYNVGRALAGHFGLRTALLDLDLAAPGLSRLPGLDAARGLRAVLAGNAQVSACLQEGPDGVRILPVGEVSPEVEPRAQRLVDTLRGMLDELRGSCDLVLIDAPALFQSADTLSLAALADAGVVVIEAGHTRLEMLEEMRSVLEGQGLSILGSILNKQEYRIPRWIYRRLFE